MSKWLEYKKAYPNERTIARIKSMLASGPKHEREIVACCVECRAALKWMRQHGMAERLMDGRIRLYRQG
jgi:hypothetical protein